MKYRLCTKFYSEDGRPRVVCSFCYRKLLKCWTLLEMARRSETIFSNLLFKGLEATHETIEDLNLVTKQHLSVAPMQFIDLDKKKNNSALIIKEETISVKEEETVQVDELVDTESADTHISEECIESQLIFEEDSNNDNYLIENFTKMDIVQLNLKTDTEKLDSNQEQVEVHPDKSKTFCCDICSKMFLVRSRLVSHIQLSHTKEVQCKKIDKKLSDIYYKRTTRVDTGDKPYACSICNKLFKQKSNLVMHTSIHTGLKPHACSICDKQFKQKANLGTHMRIHTGVKPHACSICNKQFNRKSNLVKHMSIHTGVKPHACSICNKQFNRKFNLVMHMSIHTGVKPHACSICNKQFNRKSNLEKHMSIHTGVKSHACSICNKQFNRKSNLVKHTSIHTGVKPHACSICNKQFNRKSNLEKHMRIHTGEKAYVCSICDKQFIRKGNLVRHMTIHTGKKPYVCSMKTVPWKPSVNASAREHIKCAVLQKRSNLS